MPGVFHRNKITFQHTFDLRGMETLSVVATLSKLFCVLSEKGSTLKGKNYLLPKGANSFLYE